MRDFPKAGDRKRLRPDRLAGRRPSHNGVADLPDGSVVLDPLPFLARAGEILARSLDLEQTLIHLLDLVVPTLADVCSVHLLDDEGRFRRIAGRHYSDEAAAAGD